MTTSLELPVQKLVIMEDRARVERRGQASLGPGLTRLEVPGISVAAVDRSLQLTVEGAMMVDAKLVRRWKEKPPRGEAEGQTVLRTRAEKLEDEVSAAEDEATRRHTRSALLAAAYLDLLRSIADIAGAGKAPPPELGPQLDDLAQQRREAATAEQGAEQALEVLNRRLAEAQQALTVAEQPEQDLSCVLALTLERPADVGPAEVKVQARYLVPCAVWRPTYRATLTADRVLLEAEAFIWQRTGEDWKDVEVSLSTARPTLGTEPPRLFEEMLHSRAETTQEKRTVTVALREETVSKLEQGGDAQLPGLDDGGEARLIPVPSRCTLPSDGQPHRAALFSFTAKAELERVCPAELTPTVSLVARFSNGGGQVLLAGPVDLVRSSGFIGRSKLGFAAPGDVVKLSFGSEDGLFVARETQEKQDAAMLTGRKTQRHLVTLRVSNARPEPAELFLEERIPVSEIKEVKVEALGQQCKPPPQSISPKGIARWRVTLPPHGTTTVEFAWELSAAASVAGI